ncbi:MAG TPA: ABC transporter ATP-binding protein [Longimicrobium sp.]|nr:ABC transporter ATP-binding protein [Longimicrobium sp.]
MSVLRAVGLSRTYRVGGEDVAALAGVDLEIRKGEFVAVTGPSGSGKSTLISLLAGLERPSGGDVFLDGQALSKLSDDEVSRLRRTKVGFVFQSFNLVPVLTLTENVALPFLLENRPRAEWLRRVAQALDDVGLKHRQGHLPELVSVGERQRAAIARALVTEPSLIFADEPTGSLDSHRGDSVLQLLRKACTEHGRTVVMVTHDAKAAASADRTIRLRDGRLEGA